MSAPNSFNAGTIDIIASWATLKTIVTGDQTNDCLSLSQTQSTAVGGALCHAVPALVRPGLPGVLHRGVQHHDQGSKTHLKSKYYSAKKIPRVMTFELLVIRMILNSLNIKEFAFELDKRNC